MDILKKQLGLILVYAILVVLLASPECAAENKPLLFVGNDSYPPISYQEGGKPKGLAIDIVRALGQRMGRQIDIRLMEWKVAQAMVAQSEADTLCQLSITEARKQIYDFSDQAHDLRFSIFVRTGKQGINDLTDLRGLQVAVWTASVQHQYAKADPQIKITLIANDLQGFHLLKDGKVDAVLADLWTGSYVLAENGITGIQTSGEPFAHLASALAVKKGNTALLAAINDGLRSLQADGTIERINEKWRPQEIIVQTREQVVRKTYSVLIGILVLLLVVGAFWLITLKREISERRRTEEALRLTRFSIENVSDAIFWMTPDARIVDINEAACRLLGYTREELLELGVSDVDAQYDAEKWPGHFAVLRQLGTLTFESEQRHRDGRLIPVEVVANYVKFGEKERNCAFVRDITDRKRMDEALLKRKQQYDNLVANIPVGVYIMHSTPSGVFAFDYVSPRVVEIFNVSAEDFLADPQVGFQPIHPDDLESLVASNREVFQQSHPFNWEGRAVVNEVVKWLSISSSPEPLANGDVLWHGVVVDITERKQTEEELQVSEYRVEAMLKAIPDLMFRMDSQGVFLDYKADVSDLYVQSVSIIGRRNRDIMPPEFADLIDQQIRTTLATGIMQTFEYRLPVPGKGLCDYEARMVPVSANEVVAIARDVTEHKRVEEKTLILQERLHDAEKMEMMGKLAGRVAHDLNNVLGVLSGYSELLTERIPTGNPLREYAANIMKSSVRAAAIVEDLLTLTRRGVRVMEVAKFNKIIADLLATPEFDKLIAYHPKVIVKTDLAKDLLNISGSPVHIEKTILNLVSNAVEAIVGDGEVIIKTENRYLDKAIEGYQKVIEGEYLVLTVSDTGKGIPATELKNIFEPFYTKKSMGRSGTGLGLAIVWGAVQDHNGYIDVQSIEGKGTTFTLYFPATREKAEEEAQKTPIEQYLGRGESVLVVDDVQEQREVATTLLTQLGYSVHAVSSGEESVEYLKSNKADILVLDMIMEPGIDGLDTYKQVIEINPYQKAIIVSGFSETDRTREAQKLGAGAYVKKPYVFEKFGLAIRNELDKGIFTSTG